MSDNDFQFDPTDPNTSLIDRAKYWSQFEANATVILFKAAAKEWDVLYRAWKGPYGQRLIAENPASSPADNNSDERFSIEQAKRHVNAELNEEDDAMVDGEIEYFTAEISQKGVSSMLQCNFINHA